MANSAPPREVVAGRYQIASRIAAGGMGEVFRAWDSNLRRTVALKVLPLDKASRPEIIERFKAEAQSAARLSHPNVVQVHDWGETDSTYFMVMEHVRGRNLRELLAGRGRLTPRQACEVMVQVLDALQAAHDRGLVHRDVKPENILVTADGRVKVADFGIARAVETATKTGGLFGTVAYVAPEQARGAPIDGRSDVYSAGCVLFELLTGARPFDGDAAAVLHQHLNGRVPAPSREDPTIDDSLDRVVLRATKTGPDERYQSARQMREDLQTVLPNLNGSPPLAELSMELTTEVNPEMLDTEVPEERKKRRIRWWYFLIFLVIAGTAFATFMFRPIQIPTLEGKQVSEAVEALEALDFVTNVDRRTSDEPRDTVLRTNPEAGRRIRRGRTVVIVASNGPELTSLQDLTGLSVDEAKAAIEKARLEFGDVSERHDVAPKGKVIEQDPRPGRVKLGTPVNLVVSKGPETGPVPDVKGTPYAEAASAVSAAGFQPVREDVFHDAPVDQVVDQQPAPNAKVEKGSQVKLIVSKGPQPFAMPEVKGKACQDGKAELEGLGLVVTINSRGSPCGTNKVLDQDPFPGAQVKKGTEATLYIS